MSMTYNERVADLMMKTYGGPTATPFVLMQTRRFTGLNFRGQMVKVSLISGEGLRLVKIKVSDTGKLLLQFEPSEGTRSPGVKYVGMDVAQANACLKGFATAVAVSEGTIMDHDSSESATGQSLGQFEIVWERLDDTKTGEPTAKHNPNYGSW